VIVGRGRRRWLGAILLNQLRMLLLPLLLLLRR